MSKHLNVRVSEEVQKELETISMEERSTVSDVVRDSLYQYINIHTFRRLRSKVLPFAEAQGLITDDDIFKGLS